MQPILAGRAMVAALGMFAAAALASPVSADNCTGNGCNAVVLDFGHCLARVSGATTVRLHLSLDYFLTKAESDWEQIVAPGPGRALQISSGCIRPEQVIHYNAYLIPTGQASSGVANVILGGPQGPRCDGAACGELALVVTNQCVWVTSRSDKPVALTVQAGGESVELPLEAADAAKSGPRSSVASSPKSLVDPQCISAHRSQKMLQDLAAQGTQLPDNPELDAILAKCATQEQAQVAADAPKNGYYDWSYDAMSQAKQPVYRAKIVTSKGCLSSISDIASYSAAYR